MSRVLYLIACAAGPTQYIDHGVRHAQAAGWDTCLILTPSAARWWEKRLGELEELTGHRVRSQYKLPGESDALPKADAMLVAPLSCTSLNKWGHGIADTLALGLVSEGVHMGVPVVAMPYFNRGPGRPACRGSERFGPEDTGGGVPGRAGRLRVASAEARQPGRVPVGEGPGRAARVTG